MITKDLGIATAYGYAKSKGYTGTEDQFAQLMASYADTAQTAIDARDAAIAAAVEAAGYSTTASTKAGEAASSATSAAGSASIASTKAGEASQSATAAAGSATTASTKASEASQSATNAAGSATTASTKASEASQSATDANTAKVAAQGAQTAAETAQAAAEAAEAQAQEWAESIDPDTIARVDGYYEEMTVGNAEQLIATVGVDDNAPYLFRTTGGSADVGDRKTMEIVGGTVAWNQLVAAGNFPDTYETQWDVYSGTGSVNDGTVTVTGMSGRNGMKLRYDYLLPLITGHKYFYSFDYTATTELQMYMVVVSSVAATTTRTNKSGIAEYGRTDSAYKNCDIFPASSSTQNADMTVSNVICVDLTQMFGSTIADYIYSLEQANAGAGVAFFRKFFPKPYYAYNAGELMSVKTSAQITTGFNQWDEEWVNGYYTTLGNLVNDSSYVAAKNKIPVLPNTVYNQTMLSGNSGRICFYDINGQFVSTIASYAAVDATHIRFTTPSNVYYMTFDMKSTYGNTYKNDICISISWDGERDGEYEPYVSHEYALDPDIELRGIPKLDADNSLYYDGDTYKSDGTVTRKYGIVVLDGTEDYSAVGEFSNWYYVSTTASFPVEAWLTAGIISNLAGTLLTGATVNESYLYAQFDGNKRLRLTSTTLNTTQKFIDYLTARYQAGNPVTIVYELATPTTESADPFTSPEAVNDFGTEQFVDTRDVPMPVGHNSVYQANLRAKLEMAPDSPSGDGDYLVRQSNGTNSYVPYIAPTAGDVNFDASADYDEGTVGVVVSDLVSKSGDVLAAFPTDIIDGPIASFPDGAEGIPLKSLIVDIDPVQDLHGYDSPWPAGGTKNKCPTNLNGGGASITHNGVTLSVENGMFKFTGTATGSGGRNNLRTVNFDLPAGTYTLKQALVAQSNWPSVFVLKASDNTALVTDNGSFTIEANTTVYVGWNVVNTYVYSTTAKVQLESGSSATDWIPYSNNCPIIGWTGANIFDTGVNLFDDELELGTINPANGQATPANDHLRTANYIPILGGKRYWINTDYGSGVCYDADKNYIGVMPYAYGPTGGTYYIDPPANTRYFRFGLPASYGTVNNHDISINYPSTDHEYHAYNGRTVNISWETEAGTVYGGSLKLNQDGTADITADHETLNLKTWQDNRIVAYDYTVIRDGQTVTLHGAYFQYALAANVSRIEGLCNMAYVSTMNDPGLPHFMWFGVNSAIVFWIGILDVLGMTIDEFKTWVHANDLIIYRPMLTPITYHIEDVEIVKTLLGMNNLWADTGDIHAVYRADTGLYVKKLTGSTEEDMTANANIASGKYFLVGNTLYLSTSAIAAGEQIVPGTNCTLTNLAAALNALNS